VSRSIDELIQVMARLRAEEGGCPWDREQSFATIAPFTVEEAYEVADAIERADMVELKGELGDLLFQVVFHARMAEEAGLFDFGDVVAAIVEKMVRRHPHVFGSAQVADAEAQTSAWEAQKASERAAKAAGPAASSVLDEVARTLPALTRAVKLQRRAARVGFDWPEIAGVWAKLAEEQAELEAELAAGGDSQRCEQELGDLLFTCVNLARHLGFDPEQALRGANGRFERRFRGVEQRLQATGRSVAQADAAELDRLWGEVKAGEA